MRKILKMSSIQLTKIALMVAMVFGTSTLGAQVTIGAGTAPKATLDVVADTNVDTPIGVIAPRVTLSFLNSKMSTYTMEQKGAIVYISDVDAEGFEATDNIDSPGYYYYDGSIWLRFVIPDVVEIPSEPWRVAETGVEATRNTESIYQNGQVTIGRSLQNSTPEPSAQLEVASSDKGFLVPRLDAKQISKIQNPTDALLVWNTDEGCFNFWKADKWKSMCGGLGEAEMLISAFNCNLVEVVGEYQVGKPLNGEYYMIVTVDVIEPGSYTIEASPSPGTNHGFFFQRTGSFSAAGSYTIQIPAVGTPVNAGTFELLLTQGGVSLGCKKSVTVAPANAEFVFAGECGKKASDELTRGESSADKTIQVKVNVINPGIFTFTTNTNYGVNYSATNVKLDTEGVQDVTLYANGAAPSQAGNNVPFIVTGSGLSSGATPSSCEVLVDIKENFATITPDWNSVKVYGIYRLERESLAGGNYIEVKLTPSTTGNWVGKATSEGAGFEFEGSGVFLAGNTGTVQTIKLYSKGIPLKAGELEFVLDVNGMTTTVKVNVVLPTKNVLKLGARLASDPMWKALEDAGNFGPNGVSKIESLNIIQKGNLNASELVAAINDNEIEVIVAGSGFRPDVQTAGVIADFVRNKKGFFVYVGLQDREDNTARLLNKIFDMTLAEGEGTAGTAPDNYNIYICKLPNEDIPYLNGAFGDIRNKYFISDDYASWKGVRLEHMPTANGNLKGLVELPLNSGDPARSIFNYGVDGYGIFFIPDHGSQYSDAARFGTASPISASTTSYSGTAFDGNSVVSRLTVPIGEGVPWVLYGNVIDYALKYSHKNLVKDYKVATGRF